MNQDRLTERLAIAFLGLLALSTVVGGIALAWSDRSLPGEIIAIGAAASGVIGGMFSKLGSSEPQRVTVENPPADPIPVEDVPKRGRGSNGQSLVHALLVVILVLVILKLLL